MVIYRRKTLRFWLYIDVMNVFLCIKFFIIDIQMKSLFYSQIACLCRQVLFFTEWYSDRRSVAWLDVFLFRGVSMCLIPKPK